MIKINYVKNRFSPEYFNRVLNPALISILVTIVFSTIQVGVNWLVSFFKKLDLKRINSEEILYAENKRKVIVKLTGTREMETLMLRNQQLETEMQKSNDLIQKITTDNDNLLKEKKDLEQQLKKYTQIDLDSIDEFEGHKSLTFSEFEKFNASCSKEERAVFKNIITQILNMKGYITKESATANYHHLEFQLKVLKFLKEFSLITDVNLYGKDGYQATDIGKEVLPLLLSGEY